MKTRLLRAIAIVALLFVAACGGAKSRVVVAYQSAEVALEAVHDAEGALYRAKTIPELTPQVHDNILAVLEKAFQAQDKVGGALLIWRSGQPVPTEVTAWLTEAGRVFDELGKLAPKSAARLALAKQLTEWAKAIIEIAKGFQITPPPVVRTAAEGGVS